MQKDSPPEATGAPGEPVPIRTRLLVNVVGAFIFLGIMPSLFWLLTGWVDDFIPFRFPEWIGITLSAISIPLGCLFFWSAAYVMWRDGEGTPAPFAPPRNLVVTGPYRYTRSPILLGETLYFFGFCTLIDSMITGLIVLFLVPGIGRLIYMRAEDGPLERAFGDKFLEYRSRVPWLIPKLPR